MANCILLDPQGNYVNAIVAELNDPVDEGYTLVEVPTGSIWDGTKVITIEQYQQQRSNTKTVEAF
jgi:hypothetical protein